MERTELKKGMTIFIEGGFSRNEFYTSLMASLYPNVQFAITDLREASAFGAALLALSALDGVHPKMLRDRFTIETTRLMPLEFAGLGEYEKDFEKHLGGDPV
jgi:sugar (pentulose or hexulose) kinase